MVRLDRVIVYVVKIFVGIAVEIGTMTFFAADRPALYLKMIVDFGKFVSAIIRQARTGVDDMLPIGNAIFFCY